MREMPTTPAARQPPDRAQLRTRTRTRARYTMPTTERARTVDSRALLSASARASSVLACESVQAHRRRLGQNATLQLSRTRAGSRHLAGPQVRGTLAINWCPECTCSRTSTFFLMLTCRPRARWHGSASGRLLRAAAPDKAPARGEREKGGGANGIPASSHSHDAAILGEKPAAAAAP